MNITDLYIRLFGKSHIRDGDVISMSEHGRVGGLSTGQPFKYVAQAPGMQSLYAMAVDGPNAGSVVAIPAVYNSTGGYYELATAGSGTTTTPVDKDGNWNSTNTLWNDTSINWNQT
jgi:hypothetical protein